jgi:DNA-binding transcriptional LysR family regulator
MDRGIQNRNDFEVSTLVTLGYHSPQMELRHLRYFVAVAEELSFRKAAERLHVSRPALSKQIKDLEHEIKVKLLERDTVNVALTKAGEIFLDDSKKLLAHSVEAVERANEAQSGQRGKLRIGSVGIIATEFLPGTLKLFNRTYPSIEVEFVEMLPAEQLDALANGKIDIGFAYGKEVENLSSLRSLCVIHSAFGVAVSTQHPLAKLRSVTIQDLHAETVFCLGGDGRSSHRDTICQIFREEGANPGKGRKVDGFDSLVTLLAADQGITLLPLVLDLTKQEIAIIPLIANNTDLDFHMWAVWRRQSPPHHVRQFVQLLEDRLLVTSDL